MLSLQRIDMLINDMIDQKILGSIDGFSDYKQIETHNISQLGMYYYYFIMGFRLNNA